MSVISALLQRARQEHREKMKAAGIAGPNGLIAAPNYPKAEAHIREAIRLREEAHALDPAHTDSAWSQDQAENRGVPHDDLMKFFRDYLEIP